MHCSRRTTPQPTASGLQCNMTCVSSAYEWRFTFHLTVISASSAVYRINSRGPKTDSCGTEHSSSTSEDFCARYMTVNVLLVRYDFIHSRTSPAALGVVHNQPNQTLPIYLTYTVQTLLLDRQPVANRCRSSAGGFSTMPASLYADCC